VDAEFAFASYHSKSEVKGNGIRYKGEFRVKQLSVPVSQAEELKKFYRIVASDERNNRGSEAVWKVANILPVKA